MIVNIGAWLPALRDYSSPRVNYHGMTVAWPLVIVFACLGSGYNIALAFYGTRLRDTSNINLFHSKLLFIDRMQTHQKSLNSFFLKHNTTLSYLQTIFFMLDQPAVKVSNEPYQLEL